MTISLATVFHSVGPTRDEAGNMVQVLENPEVEHQTPKPRNPERVVEIPKTRGKGRGPRPDRPGSSLFGAPMGTWAARQGDSVTRRPAALQRNRRGGWWAGEGGASSIST